MDFLKFTIMFCTLWGQIETENVLCPNNFSYIFGDMCYSMHVDVEYKYADAVEFCQKHGGILWSRTNDAELEFLKKVHTNIGRFYWTGIRQVRLNWVYLSDNSIGSDSLFYTLQKSQGKQCQYISTKGITGSIGCQHEIYSACEYTGETCEAKQSEGKDCYEFTDTPKNFTNAAKTCKSFGGRLAEYRDDSQLLQLTEALGKYNKALGDIPLGKIKVSLDSWFPTVWNFRHELQNEESCEIYLMKMIQKNACSQSYNFACKFDVISADNFTNTYEYPKSSTPFTELDTQEAGNNVSLTFSTNNMTQVIWRQDQNYTLNVIYLTVAIVGAIIIMALIITVIIQFKIIRKNKGNEQNLQQ